MRDMERFEITSYTGYYWRRKLERPERWEISDDECQWVLDNRFDGEFFQQYDEKWNFTVYVPALGYRVRVIMLGDGQTLHNAFDPDRPRDD